jgi:hypothetical protein
LQIRRVSKALEGLRERLKAPILSDMSLEWRFHGPLSPIFLARKLLESIDDPEEQIFLIAEIALVVGNSAREATASGC